MRQLPILIDTILCLLLTCCATGNNNSGDGNVREGTGFSCFSVASPAARTAPATDRGSGVAGSPSGIAVTTCDAMCAAEGAACTGVALSEGLIVPPLVCDGPVPSSTTLCR